MGGISTTGDTSPVSTDAGGSGSASPDLAVMRGDSPDAAVVAAVAALGGMERFVKPGAKVVVKPNVLTGRPPEYATTTNPLVVSAIIRMCLDAGAAEVAVLDYPTSQSAGAPSRRRVSRRQSRKRAARSSTSATAISSAWTSPKARRSIPGRWWPRPSRPTRFINVPIGKTHGMAGLTLSMKNLMGIMGDSRGQIHIDYARKIIDVNTLVKPHLVILDAYRILMRNGPTGGNLDDVKMPKTVVAGTSQVAIDAYGATLMGWKPADLSSLAEAARRGWARSTWPSTASRKGPFDAGAAGAGRRRQGRNGPAARRSSRNRRGVCIGIAASSRSVFLLLFFGLLTLTFWPLGTLLLSGFLLADPLLAINCLANGIVRWEMLLAVPVLLSPLFIGRAFCGYVCPLGFLVELFGPRRERHPGPRARGVLRKVPLFGLVVVLVLILFGSAVFLVFDPLSLLTRSATTLVYPAVDRGLRLGGDLLYWRPARRASSRESTPLPARWTAGWSLPTASRTSCSWSSCSCSSASSPSPGSSGACGAVTCARWAPCWAWSAGWRSSDGWSTRTVLVMRGVRRRLPDGRGARRGRLHRLLALPSWGWSAPTRVPTGAISWGRRPRKQHVYDPSRRAFLKAGGLALVGGFFLFTGLGRIQRNVHLIRPPGAREELDFMATCARCGECMKVCPTNVIQPAVFDAGIEGFFTPQMDFRRAYCDWSCNECGKVCPSQAIRRLTLEEKRLKVIGRAYIDRNTCIPWAEGRDCLVCQELCPTPEKAIVFRTGDAGVKLPEVVPERCIGCGICQHACPVPNEAAIRVRAVARTGLLSR